MPNGDAVAPGEPKPGACGVTDPKPVVGLAPNALDVFCVLPNGVAVVVLPKAVADPVPWGDPPNTGVGADPNAVVVPPPNAEDEGVSVGDAPNAGRGAAPNGAGLAPNGDVGCAAAGCCPKGDAGCIVCPNAVFGAPNALCCCCCPNAIYTQSHPYIHAHIHTHS